MRVMGGKLTREPCAGQLLLLQVEHLPCLCTYYVDNGLEELLIYVGERRRSEVGVAVGGAQKKRVPRPRRTVSGRVNAGTTVRWSAEMNLTARAAMDSARGESLTIAQGSGRWSAEIRLDS